MPRILTDPDALAKHGFVTVGTRSVAALDGDDLKG